MDDKFARLALFLPRLDDGGAERVMMSLGAAFAARAHPVDLVVAVPGGPLTAQVPPTVRVVELGAARTIAALPGLVRYLRRERPAAMLSTLEHSNILAVWAASLARTGARIVLREANVLASRGELRSLRQRLLERIMRRSYRGASAIVAVSKSVEDDLVRSLGLSRERIRTVYNPIVGPDLERGASAVLDDPWFSADGPPVVLGVGRLAPQKDFGTLLRAFAEVRRMHVARLLILGEGEERAALGTLARELGIQDVVRMPGYDANPFRYMARASVFVSSSVFEGLPGALVQAMACGCRVISTDCPGGSREILDDPVPGVRALVPPKDPMRLARAIGEMLDAEARGPARVAHPIERFREQEAVDVYLDVLGTRAA